MDSHTLYELSIEKKNTTVSFCYFVSDVYGHYWGNGDDDPPELWAFFPCPCDVSIGNVKEVFRDGQLAGFLSCSEDKLHIFNLHKRFWYFTMRIAKHRKILKFNCSYNDRAEEFMLKQPGNLKPEDFTFIWWNSDTKSIEFIDDDELSWTIPCKAKPKLLHGKISEIHAVVEQDYKVTLFNPVDPELKLEILPEHHGMDCIDNVRTCIESNNDKFIEWIYLFDFRAKMVLMATFSVGSASDLKFEVKQMYKVGIEGDISFMDIHCRFCRLDLLVLQKLDVFWANLEKMTALKWPRIDPERNGDYFP